MNIFGTEPLKAGPSCHGLDCLYATQSIEHRQTVLTYFSFNGNASRKVPIFFCEHHRNTKSRLAKQQNILAYLKVFFCHENYKEIVCFPVTVNSVVPGSIFL